MAQVTMFREEYLAAKSTFGFIYMDAVVDGMETVENERHNHLWGRKG